MPDLGVGVGGVALPDVALEVADELRRGESAQAAKV